MICSAIHETETDVFLTIAADSGDGVEEFTLSPRRYRRLCRDFALSDSPAVPFPIDEAFYTAVSEAHAATMAIRDGARLLAYAPCSGRELRRKLVDRGYSAEAAGEAIRLLTKKVYLDEAAQCTQYALSAKGRYGARRIRAYLAHHGYGAEAIEKSLAQISEEDTHRALSRLIEKRYTPFPAEPYERKKAIAALMRRGYTAAEIFETIRKTEETTDAGL